MKVTIQIEVAEDAVADGRPQMMCAVPAIHEAVGSFCVSACTSLDLYGPHSMFGDEGIARRWAGKWSWRASR